ncbi:MAG: hypothetical protein KKF50_04435 [Nanoarchaeota archaeon]|nr:hypothetical protein [Nanoarchaeota archaeon]
MGREIIFVGIAGIIIGIAIYWKTGEWIPALVPTIIGIALILFYKEEDKLEQRKDINTKKTKK